MDAGLPPHQFHIHPLPQHYQHYLTSPRMHHFPRNNASTQVVSPFFFFFASAQSFMRVSISSRRFASGVGGGGWGGGGGYFQQSDVFSSCNYCRGADCGCSFCACVSSRSSMRSETTRTRSCTCWLCRASTPPGTPPPSEKATRSLSLLPLRPQPRWAAFIRLTSLFDPFSDASIASA